MAKIKDAIERGVYPVRRLYVHSNASDEYLIQNLTATLPEWQKEVEFKKCMEVDTTDAWYDNHMPGVDYSYPGGDFIR
jgi:hypothetical protein